jgi:hypothetical protein
MSLVVSGSSSDIVVDVDVAEVDGPDVDGTDINVAGVDDPSVNADDGAAAGANMGRPPEPVKSCQ